VRCDRAARGACAAHGLVHLVTYCADAGEQAWAQLMYSAQAALCAQASRAGAQVELSTRCRMQVRQATDGSGVLVSHKVIAHCG
jgi:hypothetical protein